MIEAHFNQSWVETFFAVSAFMKKRIFRLYSRICGWCMIILTAWMVLASPFSWAMLLTGGFGCLMAFGHYLISLTIIPSIRKHEGRTLSFEFSDAGYCFTTNGIESKVAWNHVYELLVGKNGFFLCWAKTTGMWLPKRAFASEQDISKFVTLLENAKVKLGSF